MLKSSRQVIVDVVFELPANSSLGTLSENTSARSSAKRNTSREQRSVHLRVSKMFG